ncbi:prolipoprotein diacylglyceryl transferase [Mangrovicoccus algicola]|uniref:Phosphatidylglycerol--prolipoprotein diacylglyceryl transferase n=1 Tax=Mangrovicoccus algicola TaxID=2771008 RepID=A0A8J7CYD4_9RHOB|nr:prolipoprotein diacylglyceryl transferase [Mangrovicoccus algicola]MBE3639432.1 prolipoprotein diacylglyceryl transferase [Mangrovicoccus algicola]
MLLAIPFPDLSPEIFSFQIGGFAFALRWYALAYVIGLLAGLFIIRRAVSRPPLWPEGRPPMGPDQAEALLTWVILGVILGGRLGFVLFYQPSWYLSHPAEILKLWQGGMSFHGGLIGVIAAGLLFCRRYGVAAAPVADCMALAVTPGLFLGRIANFINAELWGRPTDLPWGVIFPGGAAQACAGVDGGCARHPSQLYEAGLEGLLLGAVIWFVAVRLRWLRSPGRVTGVFFTGYGAARIFVETFRQADAQFVTPDNPWGHVIRLGDWGLTQGQVLSLPMLALGLAILAVTLRRPKA